MATVWTNIDLHCGMLILAAGAVSLTCALLDIAHVDQQSSSRPRPHRDVLVTTDEHHAVGQKVVHFQHTVSFEPVKIK